MASIHDSDPSYPSKPTSTAELAPTNTLLDQHLDTFLDPPANIRRESHASIYSDISDLGYLPSSHNAGLLDRTVTNISNFSAYSSTNPLTLRQRLQNLYYQNYGALLVLLSQLFGSGMNISTRLLEHEGSHGAAMHPFQILFTRQLLTSLLCTIYALTTKSIPHFPLGPPDRTVRLLLICRGLMGFFGVCGLYFSLVYLPLSEATVMTFLGPILTCYLCSRLLPNETFTRQQQIAGFVSFIGVIFIAKPTTLFAAMMPTPSSPTTPDTSSFVGPSNGTITPDPISGTEPFRPTPRQHLLAIGLSMIGVCGATGAMTSIRAIGTRAHAFISVNYFSVWCTIASLFALIVFPDVSFRLPGNLTEWILLLSIGICGFCMQGLLTMGLAYGGSVPEEQKTISSALPTLSAAKRSGIQSKSPDEDVEMQTRSIHDSPSSSSSAISPPAPIRTMSSHSPSKPSGNRATSMVYTQMLFALAADKVIFGTTLGVWSWIGSGLILSGAIWVAAANDGRKKPKHHHHHHHHHHQQPTPSHRDDEGWTATDTQAQARKDETVGLLQERERRGSFDEDVSTSPGNGSSSRITSHGTAPPPTPRI